jgi:hypothetical protein
VVLAVVWGVAIAAAVERQGLPGQWAVDVARGRRHRGRSGQLTRRATGWLLRRVIQGCHTRVFVVEVVGRESHMMN